MKLMKRRKGVTRRSFMGRVTGGVMMTGGPLVALLGKAHAFQQPDTDTHDSYPGSLLCDSSDNHCGGSPPPPPPPPPGGGGGYTGVSDTDPSDRGGYGRGGGGQQPGYTGVSDSDPSDRGGYGRGGGQQPGGYTGVSDSDPSDRGGYGRGGGGGGGGGYTGLSDSDPSDRGGYGRGSGGGRQTGLTDNDPSDARGEGRFTGVSDRDATDRTGEGRRRPPRAGFTDNDGGDPARMGRRTGITDRDSTDRSGEGRGEQPDDQGPGGGGGGQPGDDMPQIMATIECDNGFPLPITISELPSQNCHIVITNWKRNTDYPVVVSLPAAIDGFGNHANGIQVIGAGQDVVYRWDTPHRWGLFVFACNSQRGTGANCYGSNTVPGPWSIPINITQQGARGTTVMLRGNAFSRRR